MRLGHRLALIFFVLTMHLLHVSACRPVSSQVDDCLTMPDTLSICFLGDRVEVRNPRLDDFLVEVAGADVKVTATGHRPFVCRATGQSADGRLVIDSDTLFTLQLFNLHLASQKGNALSLTRRQKATVCLPVGTESELADAMNCRADSTGNACLYSKGSLIFTGGGTLGVTGNSRHAVGSSKNITINDGHLIIYNTVKDGLHCDKLRMNGGTLTLHLARDASRGIRCKEAFTMKGGEISLRHDGAGGRCISVNGCTRIERGRLRLLSTGRGGKGLNCSDSLFIGRRGDDFLPEDSLLLQVETRGWAIVDNVEENKREGCPKAIKCNNDLYIYSGTLRLKTHGQGGEGIESKGSLRAYHATIIADCYDDGINTGKRCLIDGAHIYCRSSHNDGIDSNGKMSVMSGVVAAISEHPMNESFDTEGRRLFLYGGHVIGISANEVAVAEQSSIPYYSTRMHKDNVGRRFGDGFKLLPNRYLSLSKSGHVLISLHHDFGVADTFVLLASGSLEGGGEYTVSDGKKPFSPSLELFDGKVTLGGTLRSADNKFQFKP